MTALSRLQTLLPRGRAWSKSAAEVLAVLTNVSVEVDRILARIEDLIRESLPSSSDEILGQWESLLRSNELGIVVSLGGRRQRVISQLQKGELTPIRLREFADLWGIEYVGAVRDAAHETTVTFRNSVVVLEAENVLKGLAPPDHILNVAWDVVATAAPTITVISPVNGALACANPVIVAGTSERANNIGVLINDVSIGPTINPEPDGTFSIALPTQADEAVLTLRVSASGPGGAVEAPAITITMSLTIEVTITLAATTSEAQPDVSGSTKANASVGIYVDGVLRNTTTANGAGAILPTPIGIDIDPGQTVEVTLSVTDDSGNTATASQSITRTAPVPLQTESGVSLQTEAGAPIEVE